MIEQRKQPRETTKEQAPAVSVSVIVPVTESCDDLADIYRVHAQSLQPMGESVEFIFVVDRELETAAQKIELLIELGEPIRAMVLPRSVGESAALMIGCQLARGELIITLPAQFQVAPEGISQVLQLMHEGCDCVVVRRFPRIDSYFNRLQTRSFNWLVHRLTGTGFQDMSCSLRGIRREILQELQLYGDLHRFLPAMVSQRGFEVIEIAVPQHPDQRKTRIYHPGVYMRRFLDMLTFLFLFRFVKKPLRLFGSVGAGFIGAGFIILLALTIQRFFFMTPMVDRPMLILGVLLLVLGVQIGAIGLLGEMIIFTHARQMPDFSVDTILDAQGADRRLYSMTTSPSQPLWEKPS